MKRVLFILSLASILHAAADDELPEESGNKEELAAFDASLIQQPISPDLIDSPAPIFPTATAPKSSFLAVGLSSLFPGLGHVYLGDMLTAGALMGSSSVGYSLAFLPEAKDWVHSNGFLAVQTSWTYGIYSAYRDARIYNRDAGYSYPMPRDTFADLASAPFRWSVIKKREVWGGFLGALTLAVGTSYLMSLNEEARLPKLAASKMNFSPLAAFPVGLAEESFFRGYLQSVLSEGLTPWGGIAFSSLIFGAMHIPNASFLEEEDRRGYYTFSIPFITLMGGYFGWLTYKNTSLKESVALHSWYDFTLFTIGALAKQTAATGRPGFALALPF